MSVRGRFSSPELRIRSLRIRFKTTAAILAVGHPYCSYNTCRGIQLLRSGNFFWLLHLPGTAPYWLGKLIFTGVCINRILLLTLAGNFSKLLLQLGGSSSRKKWKIITFSYGKVKYPSFLLWKVKNLYFFVLKSDESLLIRKVKWILHSYWPGNREPSPGLTQSFC